MSVEVLHQPTFRTRRLSSKTASPADLRNHKEATVVMPHVRSHRGSSSAMAESLALARQHLDDTAVDADAVSELQSEMKNVARDYAIAFDIDGVLIRGGRVIPDALEAMKVLNGENGDNLHVPYIFVTNGGGKTEEERCLDLSGQLKIPVSPGQFICGHTPMKEMADKYKTVLVVGGEGEKCRVVAENYGFKDVVTPGDIIKWRPSVTPFRKLSETEFANSRARDFSEVDVEAIFVFADSRDWAGDAQIVLELLMSRNGRMGTVSENYNEGPPIFFSHNDMVWSTAYDLTRYGMGALRIMVEALYRESTGKEIDVTSYGKPQKGTFDYATRVLQQWRQEMFGGREDVHAMGPPKTVYFVGDTPSSDIRGSNDYDKHVDGTHWHSILVKTGVYEDGTEPEYRPKATVNTVLDAVKYAMEREKKKADAARNSESFKSDDE